MNSPSLARRVRVVCNACQIHNAAWVEIGSILYAAKDFQRAIIDYGAAIEINPKNAPYFSNAADAMWGLGKLQEAVNLYNKCLELDPNHAEAAKRRDEVAAAIMAR